MSNPELNLAVPVQVALTLNLEELQEQKERLESLVETQAYPVFEGLVALLDEIQDQAFYYHGFSEEQVFGPIQEEEVDE